MWPFKNKEQVAEDIKEPARGAGLDYPTCVPWEQLRKVEGYEKHEEIE